MDISLLAWIWVLSRLISTRFDVAMKVSADGDNLMPWLSKAICNPCHLQRLEGTFALDMLDSSPFKGDFGILDRMLQRVGARALTRSYDSRRRTGRENDAIPDSHKFYQCAFEMPFEMRWNSGHIWIKSLVMVQKVPWRYRVLKGLILVSSRKQRRELSQNLLLYTRHLRQEKRPGNSPQSNNGIFWLVPFFPRNLQDFPLSSLDT